MTRACPHCFLKRSSAYLKHTLRSKVKENWMMTDNGFCFMDFNLVVHYCSCVLSELTLFQCHRVGEERICPWNSKELWSGACLEVPMAPVSEREALLAVISGSLFGH